MYIPSSHQYSTRSPTKQVLQNLPMIHTISTCAQQLEMGVPKKTMTLQGVTSLEVPMEVRSGPHKSGCKGKNNEELQVSRVWKER